MQLLIDYARHNNEIMAFLECIFLLFSNISIIKLAQTKI